MRRFAIFEAISLERHGEDWRRWPAGLRDADANALAGAAAEHADEVGFALFCQWLADRQLAAAAARAKAAGLEIGLYRDLAVGAAPDGAESWSRAGELAVGASVGAPPDPFSAQGQNWSLPPPDPIVGAREGWRGLAALYGANMHHAGMLRIDHAMGLTRLFVIPDGAKPAEGAYLAYPVDELIGQVALESQRHRCMIVGEDLGTVPEGFRGKLTRANILGMRVLWFERRGLRFPSAARLPAAFGRLRHDARSADPRRLVAGRRHRRAPHAGVSHPGRRATRDRGAPRREARADRGAPARRRDRREPRLRGPHERRRRRRDPRLRRLVRPRSSPACNSKTSRAIRSATNLPGTDRERPNWRRRLGERCGGADGGRAGERDHRGAGEGAKVGKQAE